MLRSPYHWRQADAKAEIEAELSSAQEQIASLNDEIESFRDILKTKNTYVDGQHQEISKLKELLKEKENESKRFQAELLEIKIQEQQVI